MKAKIYVPKHEEYGDYVRCCDCGRLMVVKCGTDDCPSCHSIGTLMWASDTEHEVNVKEFKERMRNENWRE